MHLLIYILHELFVQIKKNIYLLILLRLVLFTQNNLNEAIFKALYAEPYKWFYLNTGLQKSVHGNIIGTYKVILQKLPLIIFCVSKWKLFNIQRNVNFKQMQFPYHSDD